MKVEINNGDVVFKRVHNGWIIYKVVGDGHQVETYVVEDISNDPSEGLLQALQEVDYNESR